PAPRPPPTVVAHPTHDGSHAAVAVTPRCSLLPSPRAAAQPPALRPPAWPAWSLSGHASPPSHTPAAPPPAPRPPPRRPGLPGRSAVTRRRPRTPGPSPPPIPR